MGVTPSPQSDPSVTSASSAGSTVHPCPATGDEVGFPGVRLVRTVAGISEYELEANGLQILHLPDHSVPTVTFMVTYRVGSRNEVTGTTGATHLLEHLMFKGTPRYNKEAGTGFDQMLERTGAETNATTWNDRTNYFETVPREHLPLVIEIEADRMRNLRLREDDRRPEMSVVRNEYDRGENSPREALEKEIWAAAFQAHPYHHTTIGWRSDIENVPMEKLKAFYDVYYWPNNATVTVIGDVTSAEVLDLIARSYGSIPRAPQVIPEVYTEEPPQQGPRRVMLKRSGESGLVALAHKIPNGRHEDYPALEVLNFILADGKNSRFYRTLTEKNLTSDVEAHLAYNRDPSLHVLYAELIPGVPHERVEKILRREVERLKRGGVADSEVQGAAAKLIAQSAFLRDGSYAIADQLNEHIAVGEWTQYITLDQKLAKVTKADVQRVARRWFHEDQSVTAWFVPKADKGTKTTPDAAATGTVETVSARPNIPAAEVPKAPLPQLLDPALRLSRSAVGASLSQRVRREKVSGMDVLLCPTTVRDVVTLRGSFPAGESHAALMGNAALAELCLGMIDRGTTKNDAYAITTKLDAVGAALSFDVGTDLTEFSARCLKADVPLVIELLAEQLRQPAFKPAEFTKLKKQTLADLQQSLDDVDDQADVAFSQAAFPEQHPNREYSVPEMTALVSAARLSDIKAFHASHFGPEKLTLVVAGDLDADAIISQIKTSFGSWSGGRSLVSAAPAPLRTATQHLRVTLPEKESVSVIVGQPSGVACTDADHLALSVATTVLGRGFTSRLISTVRDTEGLTYSIGAKLTADGFRDGLWVIKASFSPDQLEQGLSSTRRELLDWYENGITAEELDYVKSFISGAYTVALSTTDGLAEALLAAVHRGEGPSLLDRWPQLVQAITVEQANAAIKKYLDPQTMIWVMAGTL